MSLVGKRKIWYAEAKFNDGTGTCGFAEFPTKVLAEQNFRRKVRETFKGKKYKITQLWRLPAEMEIEEVE